MAILNRFGKALITSAATAAVIGMAAAPAFATAATWTVKPGGATTGKAGKTIVTDVTAGQSVTCTSSNTKGSFKKGTGLSGAGIGTVTSLTFERLFRARHEHLGDDHRDDAAQCALLQQDEEDREHDHHEDPWVVVAPAGCSATIDGTGASAHNGSVKATYMQRHRQAEGAQHREQRCTCTTSTARRINNGDAVNFTTTYTLTPKQVITSP